MATNDSASPISLRARLSPTLADERNLAEAILSTVGALIIVLDRQGRIVEFNHACEQLTGYGFDEVEGRPFWEFLLVESEVESVKEVFADLKAGEVPSHHENFWLTRSGERRLISWSNTVLKEDNSGRVAYVIGTGIDITERRRAETALRNSEEQLLLITDNLPVVISYQDSQQRYRFINRLYEQWFNISREAIYGRHISEILGEAAYQKIKDKIDQVLSGTEVHFETVMPYKTAGERHVSASYVPHIDPDGQVQGFFVLVQDITERKRAEARARVYQQELAHVSRVNIMGELATGLAHELNQPLAAIHCYAETALATTDQDGHRTTPRPLIDLLEKITVQADRAGQIIRRLRDLVRKREVTKSPLSVSELVSQVVDLLEPNLRHHGIKVQLDMHADLPLVHADNIQLSQVLLNLANNAIQAMTASNAKTRELTIRGAPVTDHVLVSVSDTGHGMDETTLKKIFEPFVGSGNDDGLGMGLPISRSIVEAHEGALWAESQPGVGTTFWIRLPR